jgi:hypothetical protein
MTLLNPWPVSSHFPLNRLKRSVSHSFLPLFLPDCTDLNGFVSSPFFHMAYECLKDHFWGKLETYIVSPRVKQVELCSSRVVSMLLAQFAMRGHLVKRKNQKCVDFESSKPTILVALAFYGLARHAAAAERLQSIFMPKLTKQSKRNYKFDVFLHANIAEFDKPSRSGEFRQNAD